MMIPFFLKLYQLWQLIQPFLNHTNWAQVVALFEKAVTDYNAGNYVQALKDLAAALKLLLPADSHPLIDAHCAVNP